MKKFVLSRKTKQDLKDISVFTESRWGREQRNIYLKQVDDSFKLIAAKPNLGKPCDHIIKGYSKYPHGSHIIFFTHTDADTIMIVRILHKRADYTSNLNG